MKRLTVFLCILLGLGSLSAQAKPKKSPDEPVTTLPFVAGHKSACLAFDQLAWDPQQGDSLQLLVDLGFFPPGVDFAVSQLAYSLRTPKQEDPLKGSSRLLLSQIWYPVTHDDAAGKPQTTHIDFFTNDPAKESLALSLSQILNVGGLYYIDEFDYPNAPSGYGFLLASDPAVADFVSNAAAGSKENAPIARDDGPFPLIILDSPGHEQFGIAEQLAARGYIVIAPTHPNDQLYKGIVDIGDPRFDGLPEGGIPFGLNCDDATIDAAKPVNGVLDFNRDINDIWLADERIYLGTLALGSSIQRKLQLRAIDIGMLIARADTLFDEPGVVDRNSVGVLGFSVGGNTAQLIVSDDAALADPDVVPAEARAGLDRVDAAVTLAGNNRFLGSSSTATQILKPALALQGRQDLVVNLGMDTTYPTPTLQEPNQTFADNYENRYAPGVPAMRVLIDRFDHSDFQSSEPKLACLEHGGDLNLVPAACIVARPDDERYDLIDGGFGLAVGGSYVARPLVERIDITTLYTAAWFDLYVKGEVCTGNTDVEIDGVTIPGELNNVKRLQKNLFDPDSIERRHRDLIASGADQFGNGSVGKDCR